MAANSKASEDQLVRVEIIINMDRMTPLIKRLYKEGMYTGVTVFQAMGCGVEKGSFEFEDDAAAKPEEFQLLPKTVVVIVCKKSEMKKLIEIVKLELYSGHIGDGKIFVSDIENAIRVRTGEEGLAAMLPSQVV